MKRRCLVTGGAGFIGSHVVDRLLDLGNKVVVIDDFSSGKMENLKHNINNRNLEIVTKSICDSDIDILFEDISIVFHLAAQSRIQYSITYTKETNYTNIFGTLNVLEACKKADVKRVIFSSSSSVYGNQVKLPLIETLNPNPLSPYGLHKLTGEQYCKLYYLMHGIETISLRYFNVFGQRQDPKVGDVCLVPKSIVRLLQKKNHKFMVVEKILEILFLLKML